jgi:hypothetical protein
MSLTNLRPEVTPTADDLTRGLTYAAFPKAYSCLVGILLKRVFHSRRGGGNVENSALRGNS